MAPIATKSGKKLGLDWNLFEPVATVTYPKSFLKHNGKLVFLYKSLILGYNIKFF